MTAPSGTPGQARLQLRLALRQARTSRHLTQKEVADAMEWSTSKIVRIESGDVGISVTDLKALLLQYEITDKIEIDRLIELQRASKKASWWQPYRDHYSKDFFEFLDVEASSIRLRQFQILVFPGMLQAPSYARSLVSAHSTSKEGAERGYAIRMKRQELISEDGPEMFFVIDESVLHRQIGDDSVMREQLSHIKELCRHPNLTIQILPFSAGVHTAMQQSFEIFELSEDPDTYALQLEGIRNDTLYSEVSDATKEYVNLFYELERIALPATETQRVIDERLGQLAGENS